MYTVAQISSLWSNFPQHSNSIIPVTKSSVKVLIIGASKLGRLDVNKLQTLCIASLCCTGIY